MKTYGILFLLLGFFYSSINAYAISDGKTHKDIKQLEQRIKKLESERKRNSQLNNISTATGFSRSFNPAISLNGLLLGTYNSEGNTNSSQSNKTGLSIEEMALQLSGNVDTWLKVTSTFSMEGTSQFSLEELVGSGLITNNLSLQVGKLFVPIGKHNQLHAHDHPFVAIPVSNEMVLGEDGIQEIGFGASYLLPVPFFSEINLQILEGENDTLFASTLNDGFAYLTRSANSFDLSDETTMDANIAYAFGDNSLTGTYKTTEVLGVDIRFKHKPLGREGYRTTIWQSEFLTSTREQIKTGFYTYLHQQFAKRWWAQGRYSYSYQQSDRSDQNQYSLALSYFPSEFLETKLEYTHLNQYAADENQLFLRLNFTLGAHEGHSY
ncbi:MAG: hypothetical protein HN474_02505 [Nitrospina sp.]|nr:hypothetical protein [Nitrospina sp.]